MKKLYKLFFIIILLLIIIIFTLNYYNINKNCSYDALKFKLSYEDYNNVWVNDKNKYYTVNISPNNSIKYVELEDLVNILNTETGYVYIGKSTCKYCRSSIETFLNYAGNKKIRIIYYYDITRRINVENEEKYNNLLEQLIEKEIIEENEDGEIGWNVPIYLKISNGEIISKIKGISYTLNDGQTIYDKITEEQKNELYNKFQEELN